MALDCNLVRNMGMSDFIGYAHTLYSHPVTPVKDFNPETVAINGKTWTAKRLSIDDFGRGVYVVDFADRVYYYTTTAIKRILSELPNGWRLPTIDDFIDAARYMGATQGKANSNPTDKIRDNYLQNTKAFLDRVGGYHEYCFVEDSVWGINKNYGRDMWFLTGTVDPCDGGYCLIQVNPDDGYANGVRGDFRMRVPYQTTSGLNAYNVLLIK